MTKPIFAGNDLDVGVGPLTDRSGNLITGLTIRAWVSEEEEHKITTAPAPPISAALDVTFGETVPASGDYPQAIDKALVNTHLVVPAYLADDVYVFLHREDSTGYHTVERCKVYATRWAFV